MCGELRAGVCVLLIHWLSRRLIGCACDAVDDNVLLGVVWVAAVVAAVAGISDRVLGSRHGSLVGRSAANTRGHGGFRCGLGVDHVGNDGECDAVSDGYHADGDALARGGGRIERRSDLHVACGDECG